MANRHGEEIAGYVVILEGKACRWERRPGCFYDAVSRGGAALFSSRPTAADRIRRSAAYWRKIREEHFVEGTPDFPREKRENHLIVRLYHHGGLDDARS